jgi:hypothetical protein
VPTRGHHHFTANVPAAGALRLLRGPDTIERDEDDDGTVQERAGVRRSPWTAWQRAP